MRLTETGSVGSPHVRVGHRQALNLKTPVGYPAGVFSFLAFTNLSSAAGAPATPATGVFDTAPLSGSCS